VLIELAAQVGQVLRIIRLQCELNGLRCVQKRIL